MDLRQLTQLHYQLTLALSAQSEHVETNRALVNALQQASAMVTQAVGTLSTGQTVLEAQLAAYRSIWTELGRLIAAELPVYRSGLNWRSGFRRARNTIAKILQEYPQIEAFRHRPLDIGLHFIGLDNAQSWTTMVRNAALGGVSTEPVGCLQGYRQAHMQCALGVPLVIVPDAQKFDRLAAGAYAAGHQTVANAIHTHMGDEEIFLRLGWEFPQGYPWSWIPDLPAQPIPNNAEWQGYYSNGWRDTALLYRATVPGAKMVWCSLKNTRDWPTTLFYPGDEAVDIIGMDLYNGLDGNPVIDRESWDRWLGGYRPGHGFNGPGGMIQFARERGKQVSFCEWGVWNASRLQTNPVNSGYWMDAMVDLFRALAAERMLAYEVYFEAGGAQPQQQISYPGVNDYNDQVREAYIRNYRAQ